MDLLNSLKLIDGWEDQTNAFQIALLLRGLLHLHDGP